VSLEFQGSADVGKKYLDALERQSDAGYLATLADLSDVRKAYRFALVMGGECTPLHGLDDDMMEDGKAASLLNLYAIADAVVSGAKRPLFTLIVPPNFQPG
jgi:hypothetical protein